MEFVDPGPDQPAGFDPRPDAPRRPVAARRETLGLLIMLAAAALLPLLAAFQTFYTVREEGAAGRYEFAVDAWGRYGDVTGARLPAHAPRFGILLVICGACFAVLAAIAAAQLVAGRASEPSRSATALAAAAGAVVGLLTGVTAAMTLEISSVFDSLRAGSGGPFGGLYEVRMRIGGAVSVSLAGILAGGLAVTAGLRVRRAVTPEPPPRVVSDTTEWR